MRKIIEILTLAYGDVIRGTLVRIASHPRKPRKLRASKICMYTVHITYAALGVQVYISAKSLTAMV